MEDFSHFLAWEVWYKVLKNEFWPKNHIETSKKKEKQVYSYKEIMNS
jgi:hypothetical protein